MHEHNGHKDWGHWSVHMWMHNDEIIYNMVCRCVKEEVTLGDAADRILGTLCVAHSRAGRSTHPPETPDGAAYTHQRILAAISGGEG